jgi:hypothetical protein
MNKYFNDKAGVGDWRRYGNNPEAALNEAILAAGACDEARLVKLQETIDRLILEKAEEAYELRSRMAEVQL